MRTLLFGPLVLLLAACGGGRNAAQMNTQIQDAPMPEDGTFAGVWFTTWGEMTIEVTGSSVVGQFCDEENNRYGRLEGTVRGNVMRFRWTTNDVSMGNRARTTEGSAIVQLRFVPMGENQGQRFEGTWGYGRSNAGGGPIRGDRSRHRSDRFVEGNYTTTCAIRELAEGPAPLSTAPVGDNPDDEGGELPPALQDDEEGGGGGGEGEEEEEPLDDLEI